MLLFIWVWMSREGTVAAVIAGLSSAVKIPPGGKKNTQWSDHCEDTLSQKPQWVIAKPEDLSQQTADT